MAEESLAVTECKDIARPVNQTSPRITWVLCWKTLPDRITWVLEDIARPVNQTSPRITWVLEDIARPVNQTSPRITWHLSVASHTHVLPVLFRIEKNWLVYLCFLLLFVRRYLPSSSSLLLPVYRLPPPLWHPLHPLKRMTEASKVLTPFPSITRVTIQPVVTLWEE